MGPQKNTFSFATFYLLLFLFQQEAFADSQVLAGADTDLYKNLPAPVHTDVIDAVGNGQQLWHFDVRSLSHSSPAIDNEGTIYVASTDDHLYAVNPDGTEKWRFASLSAFVWTPAIAEDGTIYAVSRDNYLYAVNPDGTQRWKFKEGIGMLGTPTVAADGTIYVNTQSDGLAALNPDGTKRWIVDDVFRNNFTPVFTRDGVIYCAAFRSLHLLSQAGNILWTVDMQSEIETDPVIGEDGTIYIGVEDDYLVAIDPTGVERWRFATDSTVSVTPAIGDDGAIYVGTDAGEFYRINPDGTEQWRYSAEAAITSSPALSNDGTLYFGSRDGLVHALVSGSSGIADSHWPKANQNNQNSGNPIVVALVSDFDSDGIPNDIDYDDDNDGLPDGYEYTNGFDSKDASDAALDPDNDGLITLEEFYLGTDPNNSDTDYDGVPDKEEVDAGTDPLDSRFRLWSVDTQGSIFGAPAIASNGVTYVASKSGFLYAFNPAGDVLWRFETGDSIESSPTIASDGTIYIVSGDTYLYAVNPDGTEKWRHSTFTSVIDASVALGPDDKIYLFAAEFRVINPDGTLHWRNRVNGFGSSTPAIDDEGNIFFGNTHGLLHSWNSAGSRRWTLNIEKAINSSLAIGSDGTLYFGSGERSEDSGQLNAVSAEGELLWQFATGAEVVSSPVIGSNGKIYVGSNDGFLYAINPDGSQHWRFETGGAISSSPAVGNDGVIYVGSADNFLYAINPDGTEQRRFETNNEVTAPPTIHNNGVYFGSTDGNMYAISVTSKSLADSPWPRYGHNNFNTSSFYITADNNTQDFVNFDFDGDGKADVAVRRASNSTQYIYNSRDTGIQRIRFGLNTSDVPLSGDFDGDGIADVAFRRASNQTWYIRNSSGLDASTGFSDGITRRKFGSLEDDIPVPADYDGDGITDIAIRRPATYMWLILNSSGLDSITGYPDGITRIAFGRDENDIPVPADYDGDGKADLAVRRASSQFWFIRNSGGDDLITQNSDGITRKRFGGRSGDIPVPADYDGDGRADLAVRRPSDQTWYVLNSSGSNLNAPRNDGIQRVRFGLNSADIPIVADYDGDGKADFAVRRAGNQFQYIRNSSGEDSLTGNNDGISRLNFGLRATDIPMAALINTKIEMIDGN